MFHCLPVREPALKALLALPGALAVGAALAQSPLPDAPAAVPSAPLSAAPPGFVSTLGHYRRFHDEAVLPWREANDNVGRIGGWRAYAREAEQTRPPEPVPGQPAAPADASGARHDRGGHDHGRH